MTVDALSEFAGVRVSQSEDATLDFAAALAAALPSPALVLLEGELGAGKTRFVKGLARGLRLDPAGVTSPTVPLMDEHEGPLGRLVHVDAYRLDPDDDDDPTVEAVTDRLFSSERVVCVIEWPSKIEAQLAAMDVPGPVVMVPRAHAGETQRRSEVALG